MLAGFLRKMQNVLDAAGAHLEDLTDCIVVGRPIVLGCLVP